MFSSIGELEPFESESNTDNNERTPTHNPPQTGEYTIFVAWLARTRLHMTGMTSLVLYKCFLLYVVVTTAAVMFVTVCSLLSAFSFWCVFVTDLRNHFIYQQIFRALPVSAITFLALMFRTYGNHMNHLYWCILLAAVILFMTVVNDNYSGFIVSYFSSIVLVRVATVWSTTRDTCYVNPRWLSMDKD